MLLKLLLCCILLSWRGEAAFHPPPPVAEVKALQQFCLSIEGCSAAVNWQLQEEEGTGMADPCQIEAAWDGVKCFHDSHADSTHIYYLELVDKQFTGSGSAALAALSNVPFLSHLALYGNAFSGTVPHVSLPKLQLLRLDRNQFSGSLPALLLESAASTLEYVDLSSNHLSGSIPGSVLGSLAELQKLYLYHNGLSGPVPMELGTLSKLIELRLDENQLDGPVPAFASLIDAHAWARDHPTEQFVDSLSWQQHMASIEYIDLSRNRLSGALPASLSSLTTLKELHLYSNKITGSIPASLWRLQALKALRLDSNHLSGEIPPELSQLTNLMYLGLGGKDNRLLGRLPDFAKPGSNSNRNRTAHRQQQKCPLLLAGNSTRRKANTRA